MANVRRTYIDSRLRTNGTGSDFTYDLPKSFEVPDQTIALVGCVLLPNVWGTLHDNNNRLYFSEWSDPNSVTEQIYILPEGNYTGQQVAPLLEDTLNATSILTQAYSVSYDEKTGRITISNPRGNRATPTRSELVTLSEAGFTWGAQTIDKNDLKYCLDGIGYNSPASGLVVAGVSTGEDFVNLLPYSCVFYAAALSATPGQS